MTDPDLIRFVEAQDGTRERAREELAAGRKRSHWMWFVFPQLEGLGHSAMARRYAIRDLDQARRYLADPTLGDRLRQDVELTLRHEGQSATDMLGSPDDLKFRSSLTLFAEAASDPADKALFEKALSLFYDGARDRRTLDLLGRA
ncbi:DUF1810 domain-containing protein [Inquilinus sp. CAU 1745]|uniref:DUF1810 domain-containing protein n=1 Tax=Inquilinus sp. CAU 1745 TaxID=3140369 RepID=UPI00325BE6C8